MEWIWVFPEMVVPPISHPNMIIFSRKSHGPVGETHHLRKPLGLMTYLLIGGTFRIVGDGNLGPI